MGATHFSRLFVEAIVVSVIFVLIFGILHFMSMKMYGDKAMTNHLLLLTQVSIAAGLFHILFEYFGMNDWYCRNRP